MINSATFYSTRLITLLMLAWVLLSAPIIASERAIQGEVMLATGEVWVISATTGERSVLRRGSPIYAGDRLESAEGAATLKMIDQAVLSLHPFTQLHIREYNSETGAVRLELQQGRIDTKTGNISQQNRAGYRLNTPFAALGIRGTEYTAVLVDKQLDVYVHAGEIVLSPFSAEFGCTADALGACINPLSASLEANSGTWLRLKEGSAIRRIRGTPDFINTELPSYSRTELPRDTLYDAFGQRIEPDSSLRQLLQDPLLNPPDVALPELPETPTMPELPGQQPELPGQQPELPAQPTLYYTDLNTLGLSETAYRNQLRRINLRSYAYKTLGRTNIYNFEINLFPVRTTSFWIDPAHQRLWGQDASMNSLLASRFWYEGSSLWSALPENLQQLGASRQWFDQVRENTVPLWRLPLASQAIFFSPQPATDTMQQATRFTSIWNQPIRQTPATQTQTKAPDTWRISDLHAQAGEGFTLTLSWNGQTVQLKGQADNSGVLFGSNDQFRVRGHWYNDSIVLIVEDLQTGHLSMNGLASLGAGQQSIAEWTARNTDTQVSWGHWSNFAELSEDQQDLIATYMGPAVFNRHFALALPQHNSLPNSGQHSFALNHYEAVYASADQLLPAEISNAQLQVDFAQQSLETRFDLTAPGLSQSHRFEAQGTFDQQGRLEAFNPNTQAQANGFIGQNGNSAGFLFELPIDSDSYFSGITHWKR